MEKRRERYPLPTAIELMRVVKLSEAAELAGLSPRTLERLHPEKIIRMSPGRRGMRVRDALLIRDGEGDA